MLHIQEDDKLVPVGSDLKPSTRVGPAELRLRDMGSGTGAGWSGWLERLAGWSGWVAGAWSRVIGTESTIQALTAPSECPKTRAPGTQERVDTRPTARTSEACCLPNW